VYISRCLVRKYMVGIQATRSRGEDVMSAKLFKADILFCRGY
jgi:hypothetical protein